MDDLSNNVYSYFASHLGELADEKVFHFASRLYLWNQYPGSERLLRQMRSWFTNNEQPLGALGLLARHDSEPGSFGSKNVASLRAPFLSRYPKLKTYNDTMFRMLFLYTVYGIDTRHDFATIFGPEDLAALSSKIMSDYEAVAMLSTHAVNFLYLYQWAASRPEQHPDPALLLSIGEQMYDMNNKLHVQLLVYLYTHCIIGDSLFYFRRLPPEYLGVYQRMLQQLEEIMHSKFDDINLDNKFEFLVCSAIVGFPSTLAGRIQAEASKSVSKRGTYLVDTHNNNPRNENLSLDASEHRNVLFLMSQLPFKPLSAEGWQ